MKNAGMLLRKLLYPPRWILAAVPPVSFAALILLFAEGNTEGAPAYVIYGMSAYSLTILIAALPGIFSGLRAALADSAALRKLRRSRLYGRYRTDPAFRGGVGLYSGAAVNLFYVVFRVIAGVRHASVWFISMAGYYLVLGGLRIYLIACRGKGRKAECRCYRRTAWLLFLLNIPMGGMIVQMVLTNSGYSYPGYVIYLSALYTFFMMTVSVVNLVKFRRLGSPVLSAAKVLNLVSAMMSVLGLQTAMIARFSAEDEAYRRMMNAITGGFVYGAVIVIACYMLWHSKHRKKEAESVEQIGEQILCDCRKNG